MEKIVSCCGVVCSECGYYPGECGGCPAVRGQVFWLEYTGGDVCEIYDCCVNQKKLEHCGRCGELPCFRFEGNDPTKSVEENERDHQRQLEQLRLM